MSKRTHQSSTHVKVELAQTLGRIAAREDDAREQDRVLKGNGT